MRIIKSSTLQTYSAKHTDAKEWLKAWQTITKRARWQDLTDVRKTYPKTDSTTTEKGHLVTIFNVKGNNYRLIVSIHYNTQRVYIREFLTHAEYNSQRWKKRH